MNILKVIHGYPPTYNAGSEVYSQLLCLGLSKSHQVTVFSREEDPFSDDFSIRKTHDYLDASIEHYVINIPREKYQNCYQVQEVDQAFINILESVKPDVVHIGHLNHLSLTIVKQIKLRNIPMIYTLHDYWLMCPRGQFIQRNSKYPEDLWQLCQKQVNAVCARQCYQGQTSGDPDTNEQENAHWEGWIAKRMQGASAVIHDIDRFLAPSSYLKNRFCHDFRIPIEKIQYEPYGFDRERLSGRARFQEKAFVFGYIGTHIPAKGIHLLIKAFSQVQGDCRLRIWGRARGAYTPMLQRIVEEQSEDVRLRIDWMPEYDNTCIVQDVFNHVDCIIVPSIWVENAPLVIHESLQTKVSVITADTGGMAELIEHEKNGLLFKHRDRDDLVLQMQRMADDPKFAVKLGQRGYLNSPDGQIPSIQQHVAHIELIYKELCS